MKPDEEFYAYCAHLEALASLRPALFTEPLLTSTLERELQCWQYGEIVSQMRTNRITNGLGADIPWTVWKKYFVHTKRTQFSPRSRQEGGENGGRWRAPRAPSPPPASAPASPRQGSATPALRSCPLCEAVGRRAPRHRPATCRLLTDTERTKVATKSDEEVAKLLSPTFIKSLKRRLEGLTSAIDAAKQAEILFVDDLSSQEEEEDDIYFC